MPRQIAKDKIVDAVVRGVEDSQHFYEQCSGDCWLWEAPEYLLSTSVAKRLHKLKGAKYVTLESNVHHMLKDAQATTLGAPKKSLRKNGRFDAVVWWGNGSPRAAVELKNNVWSYFQLRKDVKRINSVVQQNKNDSSFQFGLVAFYASCMDSTRTKARKQLEQRTQTLLQRVKEDVSEGISVTMTRGAIHVVEDSAWVATCFVLE